jgi:RNA polymerase sigma-70 factor (ECF subfamily)
VKNVCDEELFNSIYNKESTDLFRFLYHKFGAQNNPADTVQEAFIRLWNNCKKVSPDKARAYLFTIARNLSLNIISRKKTEQNNAENIVSDNMAYSPHDILEGNEFELKLLNALNDLPEKQRIAFMMNRSEGYKHREIAQMLGISQKAVEKRIYKAAKTLMDKLEKKI